MLQIKEEIILLIHHKNISSKIVEEIGILIFLFIVQKSLHKLQPEVITPKFLSNIGNTEEFKKIKDSRRL